MSDDLEEGILSGEIAEHAIGSIPGAVVHHDHFEGESGGPERPGTALNKFRKVFRLVLRRDEYAHIQRLDRYRGHTRFRIRAGRMPSWSRYLATVRRAI